MVGVSLCLLHTVFSQMHMRSVVYECYIVMLWDTLYSESQVFVAHVAEVSKRR